VSPTELRADDQPAPTDIVVLRLYIAGEASNSKSALANLKAICQEYLGDRYQLEIVDILDEPLRALADGILVTPTLLKLSPSPVEKIIGNLSEREKVLLALGLAAQ